MSDAASDAPATKPALIYVDPEEIRRAALEARRTAPSTKPFLTPPAAPVTTSPFALVAAGKPAQPVQQAPAPQAPAPAPPAPSAPAPQAPAPQAPAPSAPVPVVPPIAALPELVGAVTMTAPSVPIETASAPAEVESAPAPGRRERRRDRKAADQASRTGQAVPVEATITQSHTTDEAVEAYRRFAREGSMTQVEDYYRSPFAAAAEPEVEAPLIVAESLIPTGKPRFSPQPDKPRWPKALLVIVLLGAAGGAGYYQTHHVEAVGPSLPVLQPAIVDQSAATDPATMTIASDATAGTPYTALVPAGWSAESDPTRPGGTHTDVTLTQPVLHLSVVVRSSRLGSPVTAAVGTPIHTALRVFGHPAGIVELTAPAGSNTVSRVITVDNKGVRYAITVTVPAASQTHDFPRADVVVRGLTSLH